MVAPPIDMCATYIVHRGLCNPFSVNSRGGGHEIGLRVEVEIDLVGLTRR
jgi:hypothetical protein